MTSPQDVIKARLKVVCICKGIKQGTICDAIVKKNCQTLGDVQKATGAGSGPCGGPGKETRCAPVVRRLLERKGEPEPLLMEARDDEGEGF